MIPEAKLNETFPEDQFTPPYRMNRNTNGGGYSFRY